MTQVFLTIFIVSLIVQFLTERCKVFIPEKSYSKIVIPAVSMVWGLVICISAGIDLLAACGITVSHPIIGYILTGICMSGGSTCINELIKTISELRPSNQIEPKKYK